MGNYVEYNDKFAFHPGYYIKEIIEESGLTQEDFAKRLDTTPKNLSYIVRGEQSISADIALKLSRLLGTSINYWLNLQQAYDIIVAEMNFEKEQDAEKEVFKILDYNYFRTNFGLPDLPRKTDEQIECLRTFLQVSTLCVFKNRDMTVSFRNCIKDMSDGNIVKANIMVQIAINRAKLVEDAQKFNKNKFEKVIEYALSLNCEPNEAYPFMKEKLKESGVILEIVPNIPGAKTNGATKKIGNKILLMINDRNLKSEAFWFTLFHECGHIMNGDFGISFEGEACEDAADKYAKDKLRIRQKILIQCEP